MNILLLHFPLQDELGPSRDGIQGGPQFRVDDRKKLVLLADSISLNFSV